MLGMRLAGAGPLVDCLQAHFRHQPPDPVPTNDLVSSVQVGCDLVAAEE